MTGTGDVPFMARLRSRERAERLERMAQQVESGELVIRQATDQERSRWAAERAEREAAEDRRAEL